MCARRCRFRLLVWAGVTSFVDEPISDMEKKNSNKKKIIRGKNVYDCVNRCVVVVGQVTRAVHCQTK